MKKRAVKLQVGVEIPFNELDQSIANGFIEREKDMEHLLYKVSRLLRENSETLWKEIRANHPELDGWELAVDFQKKVIRLSFTKTK